MNIFQHVGEKVGENLYGMISICLTRALDSGALVFAEFENVLQSYKRAAAVLHNHKPHSENEVTSHSPGCSLSCFCCFVSSGLPSL